MLDSFVEIIELNVFPVSEVEFVHQVMPEDLLVESYEVPPCLSDFPVGESEPLFYNFHNFGFMGFELYMLLLAFTSFSFYIRKFNNYNFNVQGGPRGLRKSQGVQDMKQQLVLGYELGFYRTTHKRASR